MSDFMLVAVYGTLKRGMANHRLLEEARYVGSDLLTSITLYDLGDYPAALLESSGGIQVEVYEVSDAQIADLDRLEEIDPRNPDAGLYSRCICQTRHGNAWIYIYNRAVDGRARIGNGSWTPS
ncbi:MAG: gamma-glutamylcyclotransferase family protein [Pseudohongiellaceae bacterium]